MHQTEHWKRARKVIVQEMQQNISIPEHKVLISFKIIHKVAKLNYNKSLSVLGILN